MQITFKNIKTELTGHMGTLDIIMPNKSYFITKICTQIGKLEHWNKTLPLSRPDDSGVLKSSNNQKENMTDRSLQKLNKNRDLHTFQTIYWAPILSITLIVIVAPLPRNDKEELK